MIRASKSSQKLCSENNLDETDIPNDRYISKKKRNKLLMD